MLRSLLIVMLVGAGTGRAERVLLLTDPQSSSKEITLLERALYEELRTNKRYEVLDPQPPTARQARARRMIGQAQSLHQAAHTLFEELELDAALKKFNKALGKLDRSVALTGNLQPLIETLGMVAATHLLLGHDRRAREALERLLVVDADFEPDETFYNPQMIAVLETMRSQIRSAPTFDLQITVEPPGAAVLFDGRLVGVAPVTVNNVHPGHHYISASYKDFETNGRVANIRMRSGHAIALKLTKTRGDSRIDVQASAAISAIEDSGLPPEAHELATKAEADYVLLFAATAGTFTIVRYRGDGSERIRTTTAVDVRDVESAHHAARELLASLIGGDDISSVVAAHRTGDGFFPAADAEVPNDRGAEDPGEPRARSTGESSSKEEAGVAGIDKKRFEATRDGFHLFSAHPTKETVLWLTYGLAAVSLAAGGTFGLLALAKQNEYDKYAEITGQTIDHEKTTDQIEGVAIADAGKQRALIADIFYGVGLAALLTGVCLHLLWDPADTPLTPTLSEPAADGWSLTMGPGTLRFDF